MNMRIIKQGDSGEDVRALQILLNHLHVCYDESLFYEVSAAAASG